LCLETLKRISTVCDIYDLKNLQTNLWLQFIYQSAVSYATFQMKVEAKKALKVFMEETLLFVKKGFELHGDTYFNGIDTWFEKMKVYMNAPRDKKTVLESILPALKHPAFAEILEEKELLLYKKQIEHLLQEMK